MLVRSGARIKLTSVERTWRSTERSKQDNPRHHRKAGSLPKWVGGGFSEPPGNPRFGLPSLDGVDGVSVSFLSPQDGGLNPSSFS